MGWAVAGGLHAREAGDRERWRLQQADEKVLPMVLGLLRSVLRKGYYGMYESEVLGCSEVRSLHDKKEWNIS